MLGVWFCSARVHYELVKWWTGYEEAMKHASEKKKKNVCTLRLQKDLGYSPKTTTNDHTIPPTQIHQSKSTARECTTKHTNKQLIT